MSENTDITFEQVEELMDMLTGGELPEGMIMSSQPELSRPQAFSVIWFLQEHLCVLPDRFEMCRVCDQLFDAHHDGYSVDSSDYMSSWHEDIGVTQEMLEQHDGSNFCSCCCERDFWMIEQKKLECLK